MAQFHGILRHQRNFLKWIAKRHAMLIQSGEEARKDKEGDKRKGPAGAKTATFEKYLWYAEHLVLLESINAFEKFYKDTFTRLGAILQGYVQPDPGRNVSINARQLWAITGETLLPSIVPTLVFEHQLFHDLDEVDRATDMLIGKRRYNRKTKPNPLAGPSKALRGIFQIRHTLSHNCGMVTKSDQGKFKEAGFVVAENEAIDPTKNDLSVTILKRLRREATDFTAWLRTETASFLCSCITDRNLTVPIAKRTELEDLLGTDNCWATVTWT